MEGWTSDALLKRLEELGIETTTVEHPAAPTVAEHTQHVGHLGDGQAKQLFLRSKCGKQFLVSCLIDTEVDLKVLSERCGVSKAKPLRLTTYEVMTEVLKVAPGSVTPFAVINPDLSVRLLLDERFKVRGASVCSVAAANTRRAELLKAAFPPATQRRHHGHQPGRAGCFPCVAGPQARVGGLFSAWRSSHTTARRVTVRACVSWHDAC